MGVDVLNQIDAWKVYRRPASDDRIRFMSEPLGIETAWHGLTASGQQGANLWTGAYLQAFARLSGAQVVSFDRGFSQWSELKALILGL